METLKGYRGCKSDSEAWVKAMESHLLRHTLANDFAYGGKGSLRVMWLKRAIWPLCKGVAWQRTWGLSQQSYWNSQFLFLFLSILGNVVTLKNVEMRL